MYKISKGAGCTDVFLALKSGCVPGQEWNPASLTHAETAPEKLKFYCSFLTIKLMQSIHPGRALFLSLAVK